MSAAYRVIGRLIIGPCKRWCYKRFPRTSHAGLLIVDAENPLANEEESRSFFNAARDALNLISEVDRLRFARVQRYLRYLVNEKLHIAQGRFDPEVSACVVDFEHLSSTLSAGATLHRFAATIVHESTHALLFRKEIHCTSENRLREERLCCLEEARFFRRVNPSLGLSWMDLAWRPERWERVWRMGLAERLAGIWLRRIRGLQPNTARQPTPGERKGSSRKPVARRGCAHR